MSSNKREHGDPMEKQGSHNRSYECNFCKRGFSNAQALGGHMNIHRKDRAKMSLEPSSYSQVGFWVSYRIPTTHLCSFNSSRSFVARHPSIQVHEDHEHDSIDKTSLQPSLLHHEEVDLDLELRLGPEPRKNL